MTADLEDHGLTTALRDRVQDVHPDLDRLVAVATRQGTRLRRRARVAVSLGGMVGAGAVAAAVALATSWSGSSPSGAPGPQPGFAGDPSPSAVSTPSAEVTTRAPRPHRHPPRRTEQSPVALDLPGWQCTPPGDEKFICTSDARSVTVTWRPANERPYWGTDPDKSADFIGDVHGDVFVTVVATPGTPGSDAVTVGQALTWTP